MKRLKTLGLAAVAALALTALLGAGAASATVLCNNATKPCSLKYPLGTKIHMVLKSGTTFTKTTDDRTKVIDHCRSPTFQLSTSNVGGAAETVSAETKAVYYSECTYPNTVLALGAVEFHYDEKTGNTLVTGKSTTITERISTFGGLIVHHCWYGYGAGTTIGTLTQPEGPLSDTVFHMSATISFIEGNPTCAASVRWEGTFTVVSPVPLYVANS